MQFVEAAQCLWRRIVVVPYTEVEGQSRQSSVLVEDHDTEVIDDSKRITSSSRTGGLVGTAAILGPRIGRCQWPLHGGRITLTATGAGCRIRCIPFVVPVCDVQIDRRSPR